MSVFGLTTNVYTATPLSISLPFCPSFHHFTQQHQGLASWCLHCKSGLTIRRWLDPTHIQKHLIYLFIFLSRMASRCIISDQGDMPTSKCYSLHLQVDLLANKLKQIKWDSEGRMCKRQALTSTERPLSCFSPDQVPESVRVLLSVMVSTLREWIWILPWVLNCDTLSLFSWICAIFYLWKASGF